MDRNIYLIQYNTHTYKHTHIYIHTYIYRIMYYRFMNIPINLNRQIGYKTYTCDLQMTVNRQKTTPTQRP